MTDNETHTPPTAARQTTTGTSSRADHTTTVRLSFFPTLLLSPCPPIPDTDSDADVYGQKFVPSTESLGPPRMGISESSTPTFVDSNGMPAVREPYPAWSSERQIPLSKEEIEDIFLDLTQKFGFQRDSMRNMVRYLSHAPRICFPALPSALPCQPRWCSRESEHGPRTRSHAFCTREARRGAFAQGRFVRSPRAQSMWPSSWHLFSRSYSRAADARGRLQAPMVLRTLLRSCWPAPACSSLALVRQRKGLARFMARSVDIEPLLRMLATCCVHSLCHQEHHGEF